MELKGTTICAVLKDGKIAVAGDGQVTMGESVIFKNTALTLFFLLQEQISLQKIKYTILLQICLSAFLQFKKPDIS